MSQVVDGAGMLIGEQSFFGFAAFVCFGCRVVRVFATGASSRPRVFGGSTGARADTATATVARDGIDGFRCARRIGAFWGA